jgi:hypothetical protein
VTSEHGDPYSGSETETGPGPGIRTRTGFGSESGGRNGTTSDSETETEESESEPELDDSDDSDGGEAAQEELQSDRAERTAGYRGPVTGEEDHEQSPPHNPENDEDFLPSPELQHPTGTASMYEDLWSKLLKGSLRPRTSTSGVVDGPNRELQETDDTRAYVSAYKLPLLPTSKQLESQTF